MDVRSDLQRVEALPNARAVELKETHISLVFLAETDVFKVKKPVNLGFLDFSTQEQRHAACEAEVELNRRLAKDVYLGVVPVRLGADGRATLLGEGPIVDWAVHMRRLPDEQSARECLLANVLSARRMDEIAEAMATFHAGARCDELTTSFGAPEVIAKNVSENFAQTRAADLLTTAEASEIEAWQSGMLEREHAKFESRQREGHVRDGHGDLRLEHVYFTNNGVRVIDCIEFNERFRFGDVAADVAFLSMDLAKEGHVELAERFLASYARAADDFDLYTVVDFYESYRAYVRAKVALMLAADASVSDDVRTKAVAEARRCLLLSLAAKRPSMLSPIVVAVGGLIASGKSTIASLVGELLSAPVIDADRTRKHMLGRAHTERVGDAAWTGAYDPAFTEEVYAEVLRRAGVVLGSNRPVVIDASFRSRHMRAAVVELARQYDVPYAFVECRVDEHVCKERLLARETGPQVSDARLAVFEAFRAQWEPVIELPDHRHIVLDTAQPLDRAERRLRARVATWPKGLHA